MTILHARGVEIDVTTGSMHHIGHNNLMQFRIYEGVRDFCTNHIIYYISYDQLITKTIDGSVVNHAFATQSNIARLVVYQIISDFSISTNL